MPQFNQFNEMPVAHLGPKTPDPMAEAPASNSFHAAEQYWKKRLAAVDVKLSAAKDLLEDWASKLDREPISRVPLDLIRLYERTKHFLEGGRG